MDDLRIPGLDKWTKPNVRKVFLPDLNHVLFEIDLKQSDAQVIAWDANAAKLKAIFRAGADLHTENAKAIYATQSPSGHQRQMAKHGVHATNLMSSTKTMAKKLDMTIHQAQAFQNRWFSINPEIRLWHQKLERQAMTTRTVANAFGYRRIFFGRIESILPEFVAFIPQCTTVNVIDKILNRIMGDAQNNIAPEVPEAQILLQVHDSIVGQFHEKEWPTIVPRLHACTQIKVPYDEPLIIGTDFSASRISWGAVRKYAWESFYFAIAPALPD